MSALASLHAEMADPRPPRPTADLRLVPMPESPRGRYQPSRRSGPVALAASLGVVAALGSAFVMLGGPAILHQKSKPLVVTMHLLPPPPPPEAQPDTPPPPAAAPVLTAPPPIVKTAAPPVVAAAAAPAESPLPPVIAMKAAPAPAPAAAPAPPAPPASTGPIDGGDLSINMLSAAPPAYPTESRRRKEQGIVRLSVLVGTDGRVADIGLAGSSGSERLDKAALAAVKRWRWSPLLRSGVAVMVRGIVTIPFVLRT